MIKDFEKAAQNLVNLKQDFATNYKGSSHIQEILPTLKSEHLPVDEHVLKSLHLFAKNNPIYYNSYEQTLSELPCIVYEGDINKYWLSSIQHGSSRAPFSPTWILSAYILSLYAKKLGFRQVIDIGSGDGRIAYCSKVLSLDSYSIEIDNSLIDLQNSLVGSTGIDFNPKCNDATTFDYSSLSLDNPVFFIGGLAQMGGISLATGVLKNITPKLGSFGMVFAGTLSMKYPPDPKGRAGWGTLIEDFHMTEINTIQLPTIWTFKESDSTPYIFVKHMQ